MSRGEAARIVGCSIIYLRRLEAEGRLSVEREVREGSTRVWIALRDVESLKANFRPRRRLRVDGRKYSRVEGEIAADLFARFARGQEIQEIVVETKVAPDYVRTMFREWHRGLRETLAQEERERAERRRARDRRVDERMALLRAREERMAAEARARRR